MHTPAPVVAKVALLAALLATSSVAPSLTASSPGDAPDVKAQIDLFSAWLDR